MSRKTRALLYGTYGIILKLENKNNYLWNSFDFCNRNTSKYLVEQKVKKEKWKMKNGKRNIFKNKKYQPKKYNSINKQKINRTL